MLIFLNVINPKHLTDLTSDFREKSRGHVAGSTWAREIISVIFQPQKWE